MLEKLKEIIADQLNVDAADIEPATSFKDDLSADSLDLYEIIMAIEEEYSIEIPSDDLNSIATVEDVMNYLKNLGIED
ncbi:MAG: acyl carrier protein [Lachnospiraceae bacterium]|nr:acyl carrier protein [Lachnospiraceae bacterium]